MRAVTLILLAAVFSLLALAEPMADVAELIPEAEAGDAQAQFSLGTAYDSGYGVDKDLLQAAIWYEKAAKQGHVEAQFNLASLYDEGAGVRQDVRQAIYWYEHAANQGMPAANNNLGLLYASGQLIDQDYEKAFGYFKKAAQDLLQAFALFARAKQHHPAAGQAYQLLFDKLTPHERKTALSGLN